MADSLGTLDFFLLEGGEYLERLDALTQAPAGTLAAGDEFVRLARAYRGSAIMANQHGLARAAQGLESAARAVRDGRLAWDEGTRGELIRAVDDAKILMRRLRAPEQGDTERAEQLGMRLDRLSGRASAQARAAQGPSLDAGGRAFVAREAAAIGSALQQAARALTGGAAARDALGGIGPAMSALRGVAVLNDLPPLADILAAVDAMVKETVAGGGGREAAELFEAGARALARGAREVVDAGRPDSDSGEARAFAARLLQLIGVTTPVEALFYDDAGPHVVQAGAAPARTGFGRVEMVSQGEYLAAAATELPRAGSGVQRDLRLFGIAANLRPTMAAGGGALGDALARFAEAARNAIGGGLASLALPGFLDATRAAADALAAAQAGDEADLARRVDDAAVALAGLQPAAEAPQPMTAPSVEPQPVAPPAPAAAPTVVAEPTPAPAVAPEPVRVVASEPAAAPPAPAPPSPAPATLGAADLATSYLTLEQLVAERGFPLAPLDDLLAGGTTLSGAAPATATPTDATPAPAAQPAAPAPQPMDSAPEAPIVPIESLAPDDAAVVPVESLLYRGDAALQRIRDLRPAIAATAHAGDGSLDALLTEVFDLVELGRSGH